MRRRRAEEGPTVVAEEVLRALVHPERLAVAGAPARRSQTAGRIVRDLVGEAEEALNETG